MNDPPKIRELAEQGVLSQARTLTAVIGTLAAIIGTLTAVIGTSASLVGASH